MEIIDLFKEHLKAKKDLEKLAKEKLLVEKRITAAKSDNQPGRNIDALKNTQHELEHKMKAAQKKEASMAEELAKKKQEFKSQLYEKGKAVYDASSEIARNGVLLHSLLTGSPDIPKELDNFLDNREQQQDFWAEERNKKYQEQLKAIIKNPERSPENMQKKLDDAKRQLLDKKSVETVCQEEQKKARDNQQVKPRTR